MLNRKPSYNQLTQASLAAVPDATQGYGLSTPMRRAGFTTGPGNTDELQIGDIVNTPGGLWGIVKFIGPVRGKNGIFVGVDLDRDVANKGKNDGSVDGVSYFQTSMPQSGIFVPMGKASKRDSSSSIPPLTPTGLRPPPALSSPQRTDSSGAGKTPGLKGLRSTGRPSLPRPESPTRRNPSASGKAGLLPPSTPRSLGGVTGRQLLSPTPGASRLPPRAKTPSLTSSTSGLERPGTASGIRPPPIPKSSGLGAKRAIPGTRSKSSMEHRSGASDIDHEEFNVGIAQGSPTRSPTRSSTRSPTRSPVRRNYDPDGEIASLRAKLAEKENQLKLQADSLIEMEASLNELQTLVASASSSEMQSPRHPMEDADAMQLRAMLREKNEKIQELTSEFDAHRADFRSTLDALELARTETERFYEKTIDELRREIEALQERDEEMEAVSNQLSQLMEQVTDLEEGLEDARRGEAEARAEVEFLRGEVERVREELRREKEKTANMGKANIADELSRKNDEIRGLKAIIQSLSGGATPEAAFKSSGFQRSGGANGNGVSVTDSEEFLAEKEKRELLEREIRELQETINQKTTHEEELAREIEEMRSRKRGQSITSNTTDRTVIEKRNSGRDSKGPVAAWRQARNASNSVSSLNSIREPQLSEPEKRPEPAMISDEDNDDAESESDHQWCEICQTTDHHILNCTSMLGGITTTKPEVNTTLAASSSEADPTDAPSPLAPPKPLSPTEKKKSVHLPAAPPLVDNGSGPVAGKESRVVDESKWCALCERDGHDSTDCPFDEPF